MYRGVFRSELFRAAAVLSVDSEAVGLLPVRNGYVENDSHKLQTMHMGPY